MTVKAVAMVRVTCLIVANCSSALPLLTVRSLPTSCSQRRICGRSPRALMLTFEIDMAYDSLPNTELTEVLTIAV